MSKDMVRAELIRAIATELIQNGYRPSPQRGFLQREGEESLRPVAEETWNAVVEILAGRDSKQGDQ